MTSMRNAKMAREKKDKSSKGREPHHPVYTRRRRYDIPISEARRISESRYAAYLYLRGNTTSGDRTVSAALSDMMIIIIIRPLVDNNIEDLSAQLPVYKYKFANLAAGDNEADRKCMR